MGLNRMMMGGKEEPIFSAQAYTLHPDTWGNDNNGIKYGYHLNSGYGLLSPNYLTYNKINYDITGMYSNTTDGDSNIEFASSVPFSTVVIKLKNCNYTFTFKRGVFSTRQTPLPFDTMHTLKFIIVDVK